MGNQAYAIPMVDIANPVTKFERVMSTIFNRVKKFDNDLEHSDADHNETYSDYSDYCVLID